MKIRTRLNTGSRVWRSGWSQSRRHTDELVNHRVLRLPVPCARHSRFRVWIPRLLRVTWTSWNQSFFGVMVHICSAIWKYKKVHTHPNITHKWVGRHSDHPYSRCPPYYQMYIKYVCMHIMCSPLALNPSFFFVIGLQGFFFFFPLYLVLSAPPRSHMRKRSPCLQLQPRSCRNENKVSTDEQFAPTFKLDSDWRLESLKQKMWWRYFGEREKKKRKKKYLK